MYLCTFLRTCTVHTLRTVISKVFDLPKRYIPFLIVTYIIDKFVEIYTVVVHTTLKCIIGYRKKWRAK